MDKKSYKFEIRRVVEERSFENPAVRLFFGKWCEANDVKLIIISREEWEKRENILEEEPDGTLKLFVPNDLQLWEMVGVIEAVDKHTFPKNPQKQKEAKEKLMALAKLFQNAGIYIAKRIGSIQEGRKIAEALALEFYEYGKSLELGRRPETQVTINDLAAENLTPEETKEVDRFLAGDELFESREQRVKKMIKKYPSKSEEELYEEERRRTLAQFFRVAQKAFERRATRSQQGEIKSKPWESNAPIYITFLKRIEEELFKEVTIPVQKFIEAIFHYGLENLIRAIKIKRIPKWMEVLDRILNKLGFDSIISKQKELINKLNLLYLQQQLEEIRKTGNLKQIIEKEREIVNIIQQFISSFPYLRSAYRPSEIRRKGYVNCLGASTLGKRIMEELGLNCLLASIPEHVVLLWVTSDGRVWWCDMLTPPDKNVELTNEMIEGYKEDGTPITINDLVEFAKTKKPTRDSLKFRLKGGKKIWNVEVFKSEISFVLSSLGYRLSLLGLFEEAVEAYQAAIIFNPKDEVAYSNLGTALSRLGRYEEAVKMYQQAIALDPENANYLYNLGIALLKLGRYEEAVKAYEEAINLNKDDPDYYYALGIALSKLGRYEEAVKAYQQAIDLDPNPKYYYYLGMACFELKRYGEALSILERFISSADRTEYQDLIENAKKIIEEIRKSIYMH